jgi:hypothetical protein
MTTSVRIRARFALGSVIATGMDPYTGAVVRSVTDIPPVHSSGAFHAYPFGLPDVPRSTR